LLATIAQVPHPEDVAALPWLKVPTRCARCSCCAPGQCGNGWAPSALSRKARRPGNDVPRPPSRLRALPPWRPTAGSAGTRRADEEFVAYCLAPIPSEWRPEVATGYEFRRTAKGETAANTWLREIGERLRTLPLPVPVRHR
jgi:hypothetical protein